MSSRAKVWSTAIIRVPEHTTLQLRKGRPYANGLSNQRKRRIEEIWMKDVEQWSYAINIELRIPQKMECWTIVKKPSQTKVLYGELVLNRKRNAREQIEKYKGAWTYVRVKRMEMVMDVSSLSLIFRRSKYWWVLPSNDADSHEIFACKMPSQIENYNLIFIWHPQNINN